MKTVMECRVIENYYEKTRMRIFFPLKASHPRIREVSCNFIAVNYGTLRRDVCKQSGRAAAAAAAAAIYCGFRIARRLCS